MESNKPNAVSLAKVDVYDSSVNGAMLATIDYETAVSSITDGDRERLTKLTKSININNPQSIQLFGSEINQAIAKRADDVLAKTQSNRMSDVVTLTNKLLLEINDIDHPAIPDSGSKKIMNTLKSIPLIGPLFGKIEKEVEKTVVEKKSVLQNMAEIEKKFESLKMIAMSDNATLEQMSDATVENVGELREKIMALMLMKKELEDEIQAMEESEEAINLDILQSKKNTLNAISKRITDMSMTEYVLKQNYQQIQATGYCNLSIIQKSEQIIANVIPVYKSQVATNLLMDNTKAGAAVEQMMTDATNNMLIKNAEALKMNATMIARQSEETIFKLDTLRHTSQTLIDTLREVQEIHNDGEMKRAEINRELVNLSNELADTLKAS